MSEVFGKFQKGERMRLALLGATIAKMIKAGRSHDKIAEEIGLPVEVIKKIANEYKD